MTNLALSIYVQSKLITCFPQITLVLLVHFRITRLVLLVNEVKGKMSKTGKFLSSDKLKNLKILAYTVHFQNNQSINKCTQVDETILLKLSNTCIRDNKSLTWEDNWVNLWVFPQYPDHEAGEIQRVDELSAGGSSTPNCEGGVVLCKGVTSSLIWHCVSMHTQSIVI